MKKTATNQFGDGLVTDFHPLTAKNTTLVDALNATLVTTKGNEMILQNDAGNIRIKIEKENNEIEYAQLSDGFIPVGIKEYNGIIYIASYNNDTGEGELGSYPSPKYDGTQGDLIYKYQPFHNFCESKNDTSLLENFTTNQLNFDLLHPVSIEVQPSYDGSVNLILTDDKNPPRLINSRFAVLENGKWEIPKRHNNNDNIYSKDEFELQTSLIKRTDEFPIVKYEGLLNTGNLKVGNYTLYFKYADYDGNETDYIAWSGLISVFKGIDGDPFSIDGGVEDMNANKSIQITLSNLDTAYKFIRVYFTRSSSAIDSDRITLAYSIDKNFEYTDNECKIIITGDETINTIPLSEINTQYFVSNTAKTQAQCQNILFLGNDTTTEVDYDTLTNLSLYIYPEGVREESESRIGWINPANYIDGSSGLNANDNQYPNEYYNTKNIYYNVGYWNEEFYRLGIVYILNDNTKTSVFNILGGILYFDQTDESQGNIGKIQGLNDISLLNDLQYSDACKKTLLPPALESQGNTNSLDYFDETTYLNKRGVIHFNDTNEDKSYIYSIRITIPDRVKTKLEDLGIKGYFIVRQKRIPTIMCQGYTLPWDKEAKIPIVTYQGYREIPKNIGADDLPQNRQYFVESFMRQCSEEMSSDTVGGVWDTKQDRKDFNDSPLDKQIINTYYPRLHFIPDYAIDSKMFNSYTASQDSDSTVFIYGVDGDFYYLATALDLEIRYSNLKTCIKDSNGYIKVKYYYGPNTWSTETLNVQDIIPDIDNAVIQYSLDGQTYQTNLSFESQSKITNNPVKFYIQIVVNGVTRQIVNGNPVYLKEYPNNSKIIITDGYVKNNWSHQIQQEYVFRHDGITLLTSNDKDVDKIEYYYLNRLIAKTNKDLGQGDPFDLALYKHFYDLYKYCDRRQLTAICPEFEVRQHYFNTVFTGSEYKIKFPKLQYSYLTTQVKERLYNVGNILSNLPEKFNDFKLVSVTDTVPVVAIDNTIFKSVIGSEAEAYRFSYINEEHCAYRKNLSLVGGDNNSENKHDFNLVRGIFSPYLGIVTKNPYDDDYCKLFNIYYPNTYNGNDLNSDSLYQIRFNTNSAYYPITDIFKLNSENSKHKIFRGDCFLCTFTHRVNRNFNDPTAPTNDHILDTETWQKNYEPDTGSNDKVEKLNRINRGDINAVKLGSWITIKVKSSYNLSIRSLDESHLQEQGIMGRARGFYPLQQASADGGFKIPNSYVINDAFGATTGEQYYNTIIDAPYINNDYSTRIAYSDVDVTGAFKNGYRIFRGQHYRDYTKQYGAITKLVELQSNLLCVFEHGAALIPVNERALAAEGSGGEVYINNSNVLPETPKILSDMFGSQWAESIVKTPYYVYGVDAARKKIWRTNGAQFEVISDFRVEKFLLDNLTIDNNDVLPVLGIKNIVTHYNANKSDVMFTFYTRKLYWRETKDECGDIKSIEPILNQLPIQDELAWNICYNEILQKFETFYSWIPIASANIDNEFYSFDRECSREILLQQEQTNITDPPQRKDETGYHKPITLPYLWKHGKIGNDRPKPTHWYGEQHPFEFEFIVNAEAGVQKIFDNLRMISNSAEPESFHFTIEGDNYEFSSDKPNMYYRQEATKELFQNLGSHISFKENYKKLFEHLKQHTKSTIFPLYYNRIDVFNDIYDHYTQMLDTTQSRDYKELSGSEINWDEDLQQFFITTHVKNNPIDKVGYLRGNSRYLEGQWQIQIPTITLMQKNEDNYWDENQNWTNGVPPIVINPSISIANDLIEYTIDKTGLPNTYSLGDIRTTGWTFRKESNIRDKYCKIRIRYSGEKLAVISAVITTFTLSYA